jgi:glutathione synthase/RimK-type ligase-like ATP-grasp enzyme
MECDILDFSEYGNEADRRSDALLKKALEGCGAKVRIIRLARHGIPTPLAKRVWLRYDLRSRADLAFVASAADALTKSGHLVFPGATSIWKSEDKWESYLVLKAAGIPAVDTFSREELARCRDRVVIKPRVGWGGMGIQVISPSALGRGSWPGADGDHVYQPFVDHSRTWTGVFRGTGSEVFLEKRAGTSDFRTNSRFGEEARLLDDSVRLALPAQRVLSAFGLVVGAVDLMEMEGKVVVLEVNSAPCLWYDEIPDLDLAGPMGRTVIDWFDREAACE